MNDTRRKVGPTTAFREAVGVFHDPASFQEAIDELLDSGFDRAELSLLASQHAIEAKLGHRYRKVAELEDDPRVPRTAYVSLESVGDAEGGLIGGLMYIGAVVAGGAVVASGGTLAGAFLAAAMAGGAGGLFGSALAKLIDYHHADYLQRQLDKGGLLLWVRTRDLEHEQRPGASWSATPARTSTSTNCRPRRIWRGARKPATSSGRCSTRPQCSGRPSRSWSATTSRLNRRQRSSSAGPTTRASSGSPRTRGCETASQMCSTAFCGHSTN